jgi:glycosyltransferase involved in cell wall biosynthesis
VLAHGLRVAGGLSVGRNIIAALGAVAPEHAYLVTFPSGVGYEAQVAKIPNCQSVDYQYQGKIQRWRFDRVFLPKIVRDFKPDIVFGLGNRGLLDPPCPQAILVQDPHNFYPARHLGRIDLLERVRTAYNARHLGQCLRRTELVFCQQEVALKRLKETFNYTGRLAVFPNAVSALFAEKLNYSQPAALAPLAGKTKLFCLTKFYSHKNLESLVSVFRRFPRELKDVVVITTVAADQSPTAPRYLRMVHEAGLEDKLVNVGPLPQEALPGYYRHCQAFILPTLLESFSGTYLEAMQLGCPILTSDLDFARVICGDAALYFDPWNPASIKDAILRLKDDPTVGRALVEKGHARMKQFFRSWPDIVRDAMATLVTLAAKA